MKTNYASSYAQPDMGTSNYFSYNMAALATMSNQQLEWKDNPTLTESQVQALALRHQATVEMELKHREAIYREVLTRQQTVRTVVS
ncbi:hypothetical protein GOODEAATRI_005094 [Goodea atripinnis]|uniref:ATRX C-terminal domain-containing protein n=1 Tax=Goodea atripinnis TaxID=208336 RepID=A0ABV0NT38_9TELE